jgi:glucose-1-phosphate adenylyltransferase
LDNVLLADGCRIQNAEIRKSIIGLRGQIDKDVCITDSILMGADYYDPNSIKPGNIPLGLGEVCQIHGAVLDKNVRLGSGVVIRPFPRGTEIEHEKWVVRDGIVVIPKNTLIHAETIICPDVLNPVNKLTN